MQLANQFDSGVRSGADVAHETAEWLAATLLINREGEPRVG